MLIGTGSGWKSDYESVKVWGKETQEGYCYDIDFRQMRPSRCEVESLARNCRYGLWIIVAMKTIEQHHRSFVTGIEKVHGCTQTG